MKQTILDVISDLCSDFLYYDRKECEYLTADQLKEAVANREITIDEMVSVFRKEIEESLLEGHSNKDMFTLNDLTTFGKKCFYKGFEKCEKDDANCFTAWREEAGKLVEQIKN